MTDEITYFTDRDVLQKHGVNYRPRTRVYNSFLAHGYDRTVDTISNNGKQSSEAAARTACYTLNVLKKIMVMVDTHFSS